MVRAPLHVVQDLRSHATVQGLENAKEGLASTRDPYSRGEGSLPQPHLLTVPTEGALDFDSSLLTFCLALRWPSKGEMFS
ncbi:hypothetical protein CR492_19670 [Methylocella silvestris]|uniref:Uncharacterized protein n=1 Tax=Methylocella silvestris TaxID=199596 RepID=A0A2J7TBW9_METSI|nr:hypothetical protein CR492_19670 [Methylocella silvestris]